MMMSKSRGAPARAQDKGGKSGGDAGVEIPDLSEFLEKRDYTGATTLLEHKRQANPGDVTNLEWLAYAYFHGGDPQRALDTYNDLLRATDDPDPTYHVFAAACLFYLGRYTEAEEEASRGPNTKLQTRVLFHCAHKRSDETKLMHYHQQLSDSVEDQLSLASIHYLRSHFQEATDNYKRLLLENREHLALNAYVALCYAKLDYYDVSLEMLAVYMQAHPDSALAVNLKACNTFRLRDGKAAEAELRTLQEHAGPGGSYTDNDLIRHNQVVFRGGEGALQVLPPLAGVPPEARLNLVVHHLRDGEPYEAFALIKDLEPMTPQDYILKGVVHATMGQIQGDDGEHLKLAQQCFQIVGASASECDTIPGRQSMASCFFLLRQFEDVLVYLKSVAEFSKEDDDFHWNFGIANAATGDYKAAEEALESVRDEGYRREYAYLAWLAKTYINNGKAKLAWELYAGLETNDDSFALLRVVADEGYRAGAFYYACKAFDVLERLDPVPEFWEGKRGAAMGLFRAIVAGEEPRETVRDIVAMLRNTSNPQVEYFVRTLTKWARENGVQV
jgi:intraflagellar transport protein 56